MHFVRACRTWKRARSPRPKNRRRIRFADGPFPSGSLNLGMGRSKNWKKRVRKDWPFGSMRPDAGAVTWVQHAMFFRFRNEPWVTKVYIAMLDGPPSVARSLALGRTARESNGP